MKEQAGKLKSVGKRKRLVNREISKTGRLVLGAIFSGIAAILQSAGMFAGIGYVFSIFATLPIVLSMFISLRIGFMSYFLTIFLLLIIQPSELLVFPFTTGLLAVSLGIAFRLWKKWIPIIFFSGCILAISILFLLYVVGFPILGPSISDKINSKVSLLVFFFSFLYSWMWAGISIRAASLLNKI